MRTKFKVAEGDSLSFLSCKICLVMLMIDCMALWVAVLNLS